MTGKKQKNFKIDEDLAIRFEIQAKKSKKTELQLISEYIEFGLENDANKQI